MDAARNDLQALQLMPTSIGDTQVSEKTFFLQSPAEKILNTILSRRETKAATIQRWSHIVACLRGAIHDWLSDLAVRLRYGAVVDDAFRRTKERLDAFLSIHAPDVARKLAAAYRRAYSNDPEEWSQALTSCRRALKALADHLYPPTDAQPDGHLLTDEYYKNRLIQFASEQLASKSQGDLLVAEIESVVKRVDALNDLASKGVHSDVDERDLELAVVHTYLLAGELLELLPEKEAEIQRIPPGVDEQASVGGLTKQAGHS